MKLPRDLSGEELVRRLSGIGFVLLRQKGSHATLRHDGPPERSITVPMHDSIKPGTLNAILRDVASHLSLDRDELLERLFGR